MTASFDPLREYAFLNSLVSDYEDLSPYSQIKKDIIQHTIESYLVDSAEKRGLQLGCSNGQQTASLADKLGWLCVVDGSSVFIDRVKSSNIKPNVDFVFSLFEDLDSATHSERYDYIFCTYVLEHVFDPRQLLSSLRTLLKPLGTLFIVVPNALALSRQIALKMGLIESLQQLTANDIKHGHRRVYTAQTIQQDVTESGLTIQKMEGIILKILADFQLNQLLSNEFLTKEHILAMHNIVSAETSDLCDSLFLSVSPRI